ncbi:MAG: prolipoprotein diacylglyceryl transferase [Candidatus Babeliales bacterium]|nr:prolipoprotein diacylglyceryl transferase [Candidatus Babeliales bacterium]
MYPYICHIYGPLYLNCYGLSIFLGILVFSYLIERDKNFELLFPKDKFSNFLFWGVMVGIAGGRLLYLVEDYSSFESVFDIFKFWQAGYSFLGSLIALLIFVILYLRSLKVNTLQFLDVIAIYVPLLHSIARIGCFLAGCCHGIATDKFWGVTYTHPDVLIPHSFKFISIHPTQLYSSLCLLLIFCLMYFVFKNTFKVPGQLTCIYLMLATVERFFVDFLRSDQEFFSSKALSMFSMHQWISVLIFTAAFIWFITITFTKSSKYNYGSF